MAYKRLAVTSQLSLASVRTLEKPLVMAPFGGGDSMTSICRRYYHSKILPSACESQEQKLSLEFSHEGELPYAKERVREFWKMLDNTVCLAEPEKKSTKKAKRSRKKKKRAKPDPPSILTNPMPSCTEHDCPTSSSNTSRLSSAAKTENMADPPALATLKRLMERGVDQAALAIRSRYPLEPKVCVCGQECCLCILFSEFEESEFESRRRRLMAEGKLKPGQDPFPAHVRQTVP